jgi:phage terminase large subunit
MIVDKHCINARNELQTYKWKEGSDGKPVSPPRPIDKNNHWIDATRYAYEEEGRDKPKARSYQG